MPIISCQNVKMFVSYLYQCLIDFTSVAIVSSIQELSELKKSLNGEVEQLRSVSAPLVVSLV